MKQRAVIVTPRSGERDLWQSWLSSRYRVDYAHDGHEALMYITPATALVVSRLELPSGNGVELLYELRSDPAYDRAKVILVGDVAGESLQNSISWPQLSATYVEALPGYETALAAALA